MRFLDEVETISEKTIYNFCRKIERQTMDKHGSSLSAVSLQRAAWDYYIESEVGSGMVTIRKGWRNAVILRARR
jgi:hypothetical protein